MLGVSTEQVNDEFSGLLSLILARSHRTLLVLQGKQLVTGRCRFISGLLYLDLDDCLPGHFPKAL